MSAVSASDPTTAELRELIAEQRRELDDLRSRVADLGAVPEHAPVPAGAAGAPETTSDRRAMLRRLGVAAAGTAVGVAALDARPVAAADGDNLLIGEENQGSTTTELFAGTTRANKSVLGVADARREIDIEASISGMATGASVANGIVGYTSTSLANVETGHAIVSYPQDIEGEVSPRSNLWLRPQLADPRTGELEHTPGEIVSDEDGDLWHCVVRGTPGTWRRMSGAVTAGSFVPIIPSRVYDSRLTTGAGGGRIVADTSRIVSVADVIDLNGAVIQQDAIPFGATAVAYNLAVVNTAQRGFLFLAPGDATAISAASINWDVTTTGAVNSGSTVKLDASRRIRVFCDGDPTAATDFVIDIVGYYL